MSAPSANVVEAARDLHVRAAIGACAFQQFTRVSRKAKGFLGKPWFLGTLLRRRKDGCSGTAGTEHDLVPGDLIRFDDREYEIALDGRGVISLVGR